MELKELKAHLEAVLFAHAEPLTARRLGEVLEVEETLVERVLWQLRDECGQEGRGVQLLRLSSGWQFATKPQSGEVVKKALDVRRNTPLTPAALEVLAIVAYNQPVSRSFIDQVRGVDSSSTLASLAEKELVCEAGRLDLPGRPIAFRTTDAFLRAFGISALGELPPLYQQAPEEEGGLYARPAPAGWEEGQGPATEPGAAGTEGLLGGPFTEGEGGAACRA